MGRSHHLNPGITPEHRFRFASPMSLAADDAKLPADPGHPARPVPVPALVILSVAVGCVGGTYGIGGGSILSPILIGSGGKSSQVAPAALASTFLVLAANGQPSEPANTFVWPCSRFPGPRQRAAPQRASSEEKDRSVRRTNGQLAENPERGQRNDGDPGQAP